MRKVLIVAYYFPPFGGAGVQRTLKFVRYLPESGWLPAVLTVQGQVAHPRDPSLEAEIPQNVSVNRTRALLLPSWFPWRLRNFVARWLLLVDQQLGWFPFAVRRAREIISQERIEAIYTTSAPPTAHLIGLWLKKRTALPWVADFRDPWLGSPSIRYPTPLHERAIGWLEGHVTGAADHIVVVSEPMRQALLSRHDQLDPERASTLPNGYDPEDFEQSEPLGQECDRLGIVYAGSFYAQARTPHSFLRAVRTVLNDGGIPPQKLRIRLVGNVGQACKEQIQALGLGDVVQITGYLPHLQSIGYLLGADLLLLIVGSGPGSEAVFTGKLFEYLAAGKPILALAPPGVAADLVQEAQAGVVVSPENVEAIATQLVDAYQRWQRGDLRTASNREVVAHYDRRHLTATLTNVLDRISPLEMTDDRVLE
jgi:glycosyltransferase involved in cell wall biosynthesis